MKTVAFPVNFWTNGRSAKRQRPRNSVAGLTRNFTTCETRAGSKKGERDRECVLERKREKKKKRGRRRRRRRRGGSPHLRSFPLPQVEREGERQEPIDANAARVQLFRRRVAGVVLLDLQLERLLRGEGGRVRDGAAAAVAPRRNSAGPVLEIALGGRPLLAHLQLVKKIGWWVLGANEAVRWEATVGGGRHWRRRRCADARAACRRISAEDRVICRCCAED